MKVEVQKTFNGYVSVRDYLVQECIDAGESLVVWYQGKHITIPHAFLTKKLKVDRNTHTSKFDKRLKYHLIDFIWKPVEDREVPGQISLLKDEEDE